MISLTSAARCAGTSGLFAGVLDAAGSPELTPLPPSVLSISAIFRILRLPFYVYLPELSFSSAPKSSRSSRGAGESRCRCRLQCCRFQPFSESCDCLFTFIFQSFLFRLRQNPADRAGAQVNHVAVAAFSVVDFSHFQNPAI